LAGAYDKDDAFQNLTKELEKLEGEAFKDSKSQDRNRIFYMALPPSVFETVASGLKKNCYSDKGINRIIVEKPFGKDLESAREMMRALGSEWKEEEASFNFGRVRRWARL
jgi:glucose-6-phosphate 1-dehydrogenase